jgi:hypothetical protein
MIKRKSRLQLYVYKNLILYKLVLMYQDILARASLRVFN